MCSFTSNHKIQLTYQALWPSSYEHSCLAGKPAMLTGFLWFSSVSLGKCLKLGHDHFLPYLFQ
jgi:hypothetical protein